MKEHEVEYKQPAIVDELNRRIDEGVYTALLPTTLELAAEFGVNPKTMNKALAQLVAAGRIERRKRCGTRVTASRARGEDRLVEVIFEGFTTIFTHPFWGDIWSGMVGELSHAGYRPVLHMLEADPENGLLRLDDFSMSPSAGKILLGIGEQRLLDQVKAAGIPFVTACDPIDEPGIPQVTFDFTAGIRDAVDYLYREGCRDIAFIGQTSSYVNLYHMHKFNAYLKAIQRYRQVEPALIGNARPLAEAGVEALRLILDRARPDAVIAAYDHQLPGMLALLAERGLSLPVIGCDGLDLPQLPPGRRVVSAPRRECGEKLATLLIEAMTGRGRVKSLTLPAVFR